MFDRGGSGLTGALDAREEWATLHPGRRMHPWGEPAGNLSELGSDAQVGPRALPRPRFAPDPFAAGHDAPQAPSDGGGGLGVFVRPYQRTDRAKSLDLCDQ